ncbi:MAG: prepilin-type N-terminal cleavage/methylation domain-containing protein [Deltaproteobacteria bacterium]|nr:prepilin-type N-terminal cleavage/methylation domain-containing protein [Deltaproteobacteria bacterium]
MLEAMRQVTQTGGPGRRLEAAGFSLIEAMVASFVFAVGALGLLGMMISSANGITTASKTTQATALARAKLDELVRLPYDHGDLNVGVQPDGLKNLGPSGTSFAPEGTATGDWETHDGWFARSWAVEEVTAGAFKRVTVTVKWWDKSAKASVGSWRSVTLAGGKSIQ